MALNAKKVGGEGGKKFAPQDNIQAGNYPFRLVQIIDFGMQAQKPYRGESKPPVQMIGLTVELVDEFMKDEEGNDILDKPRWVSEIIPLRNLKAENAHSTQRYEALDPQHVHDGDWTKLIGAAGNVTIVNNKSGDKVYDNIASFSPMRPRDAAACPDLVNPPKVFVLDEPDLEVFNSFPEWIREKIKGNLNYEGSQLQALLMGKEVPAPEKKEEKPKKAVAPKKEVARDDDPVFTDEEEDDKPW
jgi:hypothetical protein